jgi:uncharacterized protein (TIGR02246 family)
MKTAISFVVGTSLAVALLCVMAAQRAGRAQDQPAAGAPQGQSSGRSEDERGIGTTIAAFAQAFEHGDARAIASLFTEDGEAVDAEGGTIRGRPALAQHYAARLADAPGERLETTVESLNIVAPGVARASGRTIVTPSAGGTPLSGRYTGIFVKRDGRWMLASVRELPEADLTPYEHLRELEWLVGDWVEESPDAVVITTVGWADEKNFLLRAFNVRVKGKPALSGTQRIGWDPLTKQIKSWVFDSHGGYGYGLWMRSGDQWIIKATGVRPDGRVTTATQVLTYVNKDTLRWKSIDRTLGSDVSQDIDEIVMVRKPPQPK